jgi:hypothetical protein
MAARTNSSCAPRGPRSRSLSSRRMRFKCANRISIFLRSRRDCSKLSVLANDRATSRARSWISRGILRNGSFGQHCGLSGHISQSSLLARYRSVLPSCTVPLVLSCFPPGQRMDEVGGSAYPAAVPAAMDASTSGAIRTRFSARATGDVAFSRSTARAAVKLHSFPEGPS